MFASYSKNTKKPKDFACFCYFVQVTCRTTIIENQANILQKTALQSMFKIRWILIPIWLHFGKVLGPKSEPNSYKIAPKIDLQIHQKIDHISDRSWDRFWPILGDFGPQLGPQNAPGSLLEGILKPSWNEKVKKSRPRLVTTWAVGSQDGPKTLPRHLQGSILKDFGVHFG